MKVRLFHVSTSEAAISHFHPLAHFGTFATALRLASCTALKDLRRTLYEIEIDLPSLFLMTPDLSGALRGDLHVASAVAQILGAQHGWGISKVLPKTLLDSIVASAINHGPNRAATQLVDAFRSHDYAAICYRNRHDSVADDWMLLNRDAFRVVHVSHWSAAAAKDGSGLPVTMFEFWQAPLAAIINARLFLVTRPRTEWTYDGNFVCRMQRVVEGLDEQQRALAAGSYVSAALLRLRLEESLQLVEDCVSFGACNREQALPVIDDLRAVIDSPLDDEAATVQVRLRTPFVPAGVSMEQLAA
ncbi:hypothetical protein [Paraburkholderia sp. SIMBA_054]|uniref:hypothetical protein n=1 Tax=Paraburkholderia sp. SIMBA_054 TaxID=3085795 RepID=UPI00397C793B